MGVRAFNVMSLGKANLLDPEQFGYRDSIEVIQDEILKMERSFVKIGWHLKHIRENGYYKEDGYANIWECAEDLLGLSQSTASRFINICEKFSENGNSPELDKRFVGFNKSQLIEMLPMSQEKIDQITPDMSVSKIREFVKKNKKSADEISSEQNDSVPGQTSIEEDFKELMPDKYQDIAENDEKPDNENVYATSHKEQNSCNEVNSVELAVSSGRETIIEGEYREIKTSEEESIATLQLAEGQQEKKLSPYGLSKRVYPEGSLITTEGCGHLHDCFNCAQECAIRQKNRYCREAPMGNPFSCMTMQVLENIRSEINEQCQFINLDMAEHTAGSNEVDPCCKNCNNESCSFRCQRSKVSKEKADMQPELPMMKNNDQRKEWLANYKVWGIWYYDERIDVNYYKYDFSDGSRLVVAEYPQRQCYWKKNIIEDEHYYHLLQVDKKGENFTYNEKFRNSTDAEGYIVDFLKNLQKPKERRENK